MPGLCVLITTLQTSAPSTSPKLCATTSRVGRGQSAMTPMTGAVVKKRRLYFYDGMPPARSQARGQCLCN